MIYQIIQMSLNGMRFGFRDISATGGLTGSRDFVSIKNQMEHPF